MTDFEEWIIDNMAYYSWDCVGDGTINVEDLREYIKGKTLVDTEDLEFLIENFDIEKVELWAKYKSSYKRILEQFEKIKTKYAERINE